MKRIADWPRRKKIQWKLRLLWALLALMLVYMVVVGETGGDSRIQTRLAEVFGRIAYFGGLGVIVWRIVHNRRLLRDRQKLREDAARERDERAQSLHDRSGGAVVDALLVAELLLTMTLSFYNMAAFHTALLCLGMTALFKAAAWAALSRLS